MFVLRSLRDPGTLHLLTSVHVFSRPLRVRLYKQDYSLVLDLHLQFETLASMVIYTLF